MSALPQLKAKQEVSEVRPQPAGLEAQKMEAIGRLVSGVAHDFNNLLTGIVLCSDLLLAGLEKKSRLRRYAQEIRMAGARGADMIQQLLAWAGQRSIETQVLSLNDVIAEMSHLLTRLIGENITLVSELAEDLALVQMAPAQVEQIILNLVLNARDAMPDGGRITLITRNHSDRTVGAEERDFPLRYVQFEVCDCGRGMDAETRSRIFEPFFTTKSPGRGSGLGLATVDSVVKNSGGTVEIDSAPANGTRVKICLPAAQAGLPGRAAQVTPKAGSGPSPASQPRFRPQGE
jgi:two-component system, cell cycle sensor histidine kinase and response regulator CckA